MRHNADSLDKWFPRKANMPLVGGETAVGWLPEGVDEGSCCMARSGGRPAKNRQCAGRSIELLKSVSWLMSGAQEFAVLLNRAHKAPESSNRRETTFQPKYINHFRQIYLV
jgi:hypothetical protein